MSRIPALLIATLLMSTHAALSAESCNQTAGPAKARQLVQQCLDVSPATHPPCNVANACSVIEAEIRRGCVFVDKDAPAFCIPYRRSSRP
jgi:hypothetical protein